MASLPSIRDLSLAEIEQAAATMGMAKYRVAQIADWVHKKGITSFAEMTNLSAKLRDKLASRFSPGGVSVVERRISRDGATEKYLLKLKDGQAVESVLMQYSYGISACISTQVGCRMGCSICASGLEGLVRNLSPGEILDQIWVMQRHSGKRVKSIVLMGSGEPLDNYDSTVKFLELVNAEYGLNVGYRHITLSTCGIVPRIYELAKLRLPITLAVSLHAPNDQLRNELIPVNRSYPLGDLIPACGTYAETTGRRVSFEYALLHKKNDLRRHAVELTGLLKGIHCHINLIPVNPVPERGVERSNPNSVREFKAVVEDAGYPVTLRRELGLDIDAACGQLRRRVIIAGRAGKPR